jgi:hypothetical protein
VTAIYNDQRRIGRSWELSGSNSPEPTLVLNEKPVEKHGSGVTYRLRLGAHCLYHAKSCLGEFYRKMKWRLGAAEAVTATAHKLARIAYHLLSTRESYSESVLAKCDQQTNTRAERRVRQQAAKLRFQLTPMPEPEL